MAVCRNIAISLQFPKTPKNLLHVKGVYDISQTLLNACSIAFTQLNSFVCPPLADSKEPSTRITPTCGNWQRLS